MQLHHKETDTSATTDSQPETKPEPGKVAQPASDRGWYIRRVVGFILILIAGLLLAVVLVPFMHP